VNRKSENAMVKSKPRIKKAKTEAPAAGKGKRKAEEQPKQGKKGKSAENGGEEAAPGTTAFVSGLSFEATEEQIREYFGACGEIKNVSLPARPDGKPKGIAFVEFSSQEAVNKALELDQQTPDWNNERYLKIKVSESRAKTSFSREPSAKPEGCKTVFVGNLSWGADEDSITATFADCGTVTNVRIATDRDTGQSKGFAHVEFEEDDAVDKAIAKTGTELDGRAIRVDYAGGSGGGGGGGRGGRGRGRGDSRGRGRGGRGRGGGDFRGGRGRGGRGGGDFRGGRGRGGRGGRGGKPFKTRYCRRSW